MTMKSLALLLVTVGALSVSVATQPVAPAPIHAQTDGPAACQDLVRQALREIGSSCRELGRNEACYGNTRVDAELSSDAFIFDENGDIVGVDSLTRLTTQPANPDLNEWGIAVLDLQADLPESSDENVRLLLFGGVDIAPTAPPGIDPDQPTCTLTNAGNTNLNMRVGPGTRFTVVDSLQPGQNAIGYGISADGAWLRTARGWVAAAFSAGDCDAADLLVIEETSQAYFAPMQSFTMSLGAGGSCDTAPSGLLIQAPTDQTANIMINEVELRVGSTAYVTFSDEDTMLIGNLEGDVTATANGVSQTLQEGEGTTVDQGETGPSDPTDPEPLGDTIEHLTEDVYNALPRPIGTPQYVPSTTFNTNTGDSNGGHTNNTRGTWLPCGSCNSCGYPQNECVTSPEGACLWDPTTCRQPTVGLNNNDPINPDPIDPDPINPDPIDPDPIDPDPIDPDPINPGPIISGPSIITCAPSEQVTYTIHYNNPDGSVVEDSGADGSGFVNGQDATTVSVVGDCPRGVTQGDNFVTVIIYASNGQQYTWTTRLVLG